MQKPQGVRHGDVSLIKVDALPEGLKPSPTKTLMQGSHGNHHDIENGTIYLSSVNQYVIGYLVADKGCTLLHPEHFDKTNPANEAKNIKTAKLPEGVYEIRAQFEHKHESMTQVID